MPAMKRILINSGLALALTGCGLSMPELKIPRVHKISVQQGNVITQEMVDRLTPGMTRSQVVYVMGEPVLKNPFNEDRWDYLYTLDVPGVIQSEQRLSLFFENDLLAEFKGNFLPTEASVNAEDGVEDEHIIPDRPLPEPAPVE